MKSVTRFAPSPTGLLHLGGARTALFNFLFARQTGGKFILRIEDTDRERSRKEYEADIVRGLEWLGLKTDRTFRQSDRAAIYKKHLARLIEKDRAYFSREAEKAGGREEIIRFRNPRSKVVFRDIIRGEVAFDTGELGDFVIAKSLEEPLYHLAAVVDDFEMEVSHVIRGEDHLSNTPRQILIQRALEFPGVSYAHLPLILAADRSKLSKRKHGQSVSLSFWRNKGILPEAMINFLALLGWNPGTNQELFSFSELIKEFKLEKIQKGGAVFNPEKLDWLNREYLKRLPPAEQQQAVFRKFGEYKKASWFWSEKLAGQLTPLIVQRINKWGEIKTLIEQGEFDFFFEAPKLAAEQIGWSGTPPAKTREHLIKARELLKDLPAEKFNAKIIKERLSAYVGPAGRGEVFWPLRYSLTGRRQSPDLFSIAEILGPAETLRRWQKAEEILKKSESVS